MISLSELSVDNFNRVLGATIDFMKKSELHFQEAGQDMDDIINMRLAPDMLPFTFQINSVRHHSLHAIQGLLSGEFGPPAPLPELNYAGLVKLLEDAQSDLMAISREKIEAQTGQTVTFKMGSTAIPFTAENFIMSFSLPNLYFHAATTYDILRVQSAPLEKIDFLGQMKVGVAG
jgi:hypothetical protein